MATFAISALRLSTGLNMPQVKMLLRSQKFTIFVNLHVPLEAICFPHKIFSWE